MSVKRFAHTCAGLLCFALSTAHVSPIDAHVVDRRPMPPEFNFASDSLFPVSHDAAHAPWVLERLRPILAKFPNHAPFRQIKFWALANTGAPAGRLVALTDSLIGGIFPSGRVEPPGRLQQATHCLELGQVLFARRESLTVAEAYLRRAVQYVQPAHSASMREACEVLLAQIGHAKDAAAPDTLPFPRPGDEASVQPAAVRPWWDSPLVGALFGALVSGAITSVVSLRVAMRSQIAAERRARGKEHRDSLARLERRCTDYLNEIISNKSRAREAEAAARQGDLFWYFPHAFTVDPRFASEILDLDLNNLVMACNLEMSRFNYWVERLRQAHDDMQRVFLDRNFLVEDWKKHQASQAEGWVDIANILDAIEEQVRDISVRAILLVRQYDSEAARRRRRDGLGDLTPWSLDARDVAAERREFDVRRQAKLDESKREMEDRRQRRQSGPAGPGRAPRPSGPEGGTS